MSELIREYDVVHLPPGPQWIEAEAHERAALARRFGLVAIEAFAAEVILLAEGRAVVVRGRIAAEVVQSCAVSGEDLAVSLTEPVELRFVPASRAAVPAEEIELTAAELDEIELTGTRLELGEALAQTLALAIDPYAAGPHAEAARRQAGLLAESRSGPLAALKGLLKK